MMDLTIILATIVLVLVVYFYFSRSPDSFSKQGIPGPKGWPLFGNLFEVFRMGINDYDEMCKKKYGKVVRRKIFGVDSLAIYDVDLLKQIMVKESGTFTDHGTPFKSPPPLHRGLTTLTGDEWKRVRHAVTPTFTSGKLKKMTSLILRSANILSDRFAYFADNNQDVDVKDLFSRFTMNVIADTMFGMEIDAMTNENDEFSKNAKKIMQIDVFRVLQLVLQTTPGLKQLFGLLPDSVTRLPGLDFMANALEQAIKARKGKEDEFPDFLSLMLKAEVDEDELQGLGDKARGLSKDEILAQCLIFMLAGYETTSVALAYTAYQLALHPEHQERCREEVTANFCDDAPEQLYESVSRLTYLDQCLKESLRLYPPASRTDRSANEDITLGGLTIPKGTLVAIPIYSVLHDPELWPQPYTFDPDRFAGDDGDLGKLPFHFLVFGAGPRNCIGMRFALLEAKLALARVLKNFRFVTCEKTPKEPLKFSFVGASKPKVPIVLRAEKI